MLQLITVGRSVGRSVGRQTFTTEVDPTVFFASKSRPKIFFFFASKSRQKKIFFFVSKSRPNNFVFSNGIQIFHSLYHAQNVSSGSKYDSSRTS